MPDVFGADGRVSTHSRLKAADVSAETLAKLDGFNTQPPEGGCRAYTARFECVSVSTHSRLKAAGLFFTDWK